MHVALQRKHYIRTQQELLDRILDAIKRGDEGDEFNEYMKQARFVPLAIRSVYYDVDEDLFAAPESVEIIAKVAKRYIEITYGYLISRDHSRFDRCVNYYRAWKWLLGHKDADTFHLSDDGLGVLWRTTILEKLIKQIQLGEWDAMTKQAQMESEASN